jgi:hypothetical protein
MVPVNSGMPGRSGIQGQAPHGVLQMRTLKEAMIITGVTLVLFSAAMLIIILFT